jgi:hypothetical protein
MIGNEFDPPPKQTDLNREKSARSFSEKLIEFFDYTHLGQLYGNQWEFYPSDSELERLSSYCPGTVELGFSGDPYCSDEKINSLVISAQDKLDLRFLNRKPSKLMRIEPVGVDTVFKRMSEINEPPLIEPSWQERYFGS